MRSQIPFPTGGFKGLVFDLDGTLVDSMPAHYAAWLEAFTEFDAGEYFPEDLFYSLGGVPTRDIIKLINEKNSLNLDVDAVAEAKKEAFFRQLHKLTLIEPVVDFAKKWHGQVPMAIATGGRGAVVGKTMERLKLDALFLPEAIVTADQVTNGKPAPDIFLEAARRIGIAPEDCVAFEDAPAGLASAAKAGMTVVKVPA